MAIRQRSYLSARSLLCYGGVLVVSFAGLVLVAGPPPERRPLSVSVGVSPDVSRNDSRAPSLVSSGDSSGDTFGQAPEPLSNQVPQGPGDRHATHHRVDMDGAVLSIPRALFRFEDQHLNRPVDQIDLAVHWPSLDGFSPARAAAFNDVSDTSPIVLMAISQTENELDSTARLAMIYVAAFLQDPLAAPPGLIARRLDPKAGYQNEVVFFEAGSTEPFTALCSFSDDPKMPSDCLRDINMPGGLTLSYRFRASLIGSWRALDAAMYALFTSFLSSDP